MRCRFQPTSVRVGATVVETAVIMGVFVLILFGVVEYCRVIWFEQVMINAAREGSRYAVVNTQDPNVVNDTRNLVSSELGACYSQGTNYDIRVFKTDTNGNNSGQPGDAKFGEIIMVEVECDYRPLFPSLLMMDQTIRLKASAPMNCEAN